MPALGESVTEGTVTRWLKQVGDTVEADEPLLEVSTDKVDTEIPSPAAGTLLEIKVGEDETVAVGAELAVIGAAGGSPRAPAPAAAHPPRCTSTRCSGRPDGSRAGRGTCRTGTRIRAAGTGTRASARGRTGRRRLRPHLPHPRTAPTAAATMRTART